MRFQVGTEIHPAHEVNLTSMAQQRVLSRRGGPDFIRKTLSVEGVLIPDNPTQATLTTAIAALESDYSNTLIGDVGLLEDNETRTPHFLDNSDSESGVRLLSLNYPRGDSAEYATGRTFTAVFQADFLDPAASGILFWQETISATGNGGPRNVLLEVDVGLPVEQTVSTNTPCFATQSGVCVGRNSWLAPATPLWPSLELSFRRQISSSTPNFRNGVPVEFSRRWSYSFQSPTSVFFGNNPTVV